MIDKNSALYSVPLAVAVANKGMVVSPVPGTPLSELVKTTNDMMMASPQCSPDSTSSPENQLNSFVCDLEYLTTNKATASVHDDLLDGFIADISKAVTSHISFAKNVVRPVVIEMAETTIKAMGETVSPTAGFNIEVVDLPKPMQNSGFETSIKKYDEKPFIAPERELRLGEMAPQNLLELMKIGSKEYDERVSEWFASKGDLFFMDIWNNLFRDFKVSKPSVVFNFMECFTKGECVIDCALAVHLMTRKLYDEIPENTGMSLSEFRNLMAQYREASGVKLNQEYLRYANVLKNKTLVVSYNADGKGCCVNGAVYRDWLKDGASNEILLGLIVSGTMIYTQSLIDDVKEKAIKDWNNFSLFSLTAEKNKSFNKFKDVLALSFASTLNHITEEEKVIIATNSGYFDKVNQVLSEEIAKLTSKDMTDIYGVCMSLVCKSRYYYTDAEKILNGINEAVRVNPNIDIREAALLSSIEYVVDYISDQMKLTSN